jgi:hypothetical protein
MTRHAHVPLAVAALGAAVLLTGCGTANGGSDRLSAGAHPSPHVSLYPTPIRTTESHAYHPSIDWAHPFGGGTVVNTRALANPKALGLSFTPVVPHFAAAPSSVFVSTAGSRLDQHVVLVYEFTKDSRLPDPEVTLRESSDSRTQADLAAELNNPPGDPADFSLKTIDGTTVLMIVNGDRSRAQFLHGGLLYDITGPEVPEAVSVDLTTQLLQQLG